MPEFRPWPPIARLNRDMVITEKIDGTNAAVGIGESGEVYAQSRTRIITPEADNFGFAAWVARHDQYLFETLGPGLHFGEWWGNGIQRGYGLPKGRRCFSLFNVKRYGPYFNRPDLGYSGEALDDDSSIGTVPVLYEGLFNTGTIENTLDMLRSFGSVAQPGFMNPEGIVVFHAASGTLFKATIENDEKPKSLVQR